MPSPIEVIEYFLNESSNPPYSGPAYTWIDSSLNWRLYAAKCDKWSSQEHTEIWEYELSRVVAKNWSVDHKDIRKLWYAFPRFRVAVKDSPEYIQLSYYRSLKTRCLVIHGGDLKGKVSQSSIEEAYCLKSRETTYIVSDHEKCITSQKEAIRRLLRIREDWPSISNPRVLS